MGIPWWSVGALWGCGAAREPASPIAEVPPGPSASASAPEPGVARLTPEQVQQTLLVALGQNYGFQYGDGQSFSYVTGHLAVPLGGVDYSARVRQRDPTTKVQTLLVARSVAWPIAVQVVSAELEATEPVLFGRCRFAEDYPTRDPESRARWEAQVAELYLRLFSRAPTREELATIEATFEDVRIREDDLAAAWLVTLYALVSSVEVWNTWR